MALHAVNSQVAGQRAAAAVFHHIADHFGTGRFADQTIVQTLVTRHQRLHHFDGAVFGAGLFIRGDQKRQSAPVVRVLRDKTLCGNHHRRQRAFHIRRSAAKQHPVADGRFERGIDPAVGVACRDYVGVAGEGQRLAVAAPGPEILCIAEIHWFNGKADRTQAFNH